MHRGHPKRDSRHIPCTPWLRPCLHAPPTLFKSPTFLVSQTERRQHRQHCLSLQCHRSPCHDQRPVPPRHMRSSTFSFQATCATRRTRVSQATVIEPRMLARTPRGPVSLRQSTARMPSFLPCQHKRELCSSRLSSASSQRAQAVEARPRPCLKLITTSMNTHQHRQHLALARHSSRTPTQQLQQQCGRKWFHWVAAAASRPLM
jgi:hypothetical protein